MADPVTRCAVKKHETRGHPQVVLTGDATGFGALGAGQPQGAGAQAPISLGEVIRPFFALVLRAKRKLYACWIRNRIRHVSMNNWPFQSMLSPLCC